MKLTSEEITKISKLARIRLSDDEKQIYGDEITNILTWIEQLQDVNVDHISLDDLVPKEPMTERDDVVNDGDKVQLILKNAPKTNYDMFSVPKMVE